MLRPVSRVPAKFLEALAPRDAGEHREAAEIAPEAIHNTPLYNTKNGPGGRDEGTLADLGWFVGFRRLTRGSRSASSRRASGRLRPAALAVMTTGSTGRNVDGHKRSD